MSASYCEGMIAITGGIAEGKSTVLGYLAEAGMRTASADELARTVFDTEAVQAWLRARLDAVSPDAVRDALSHDPAFRRDFNRLTHPLILKALLSREVTAVEVPLLIESCLQQAFSEVWVVTCGETEQLRRVIARLGEDRGRSILATQLPTRAKIPFADRIVRTNFPEESVRAYVFEAVHGRLG